MFPHIFSSTGTSQGYALRMSSLLNPQEGEVLGEVDRGRLRQLVADADRPVQGVILLRDRPVLEGLRALEAAQRGDDPRPHRGERQRAERLRSAQRPDGEGPQERREPGLSPPREREEPPRRRFGYREPRASREPRRRRRDVNA